MRTKKWGAAAACLALAFAVSAFASCAASDNGGGFGADMFEAGYAAGPAPGGDTYGDEGDGQGEDSVLPLPGQLTAGAWDDNRNYAFFKSLFESAPVLSDDGQTREEAGIFSSYQSSEKAFDEASAWGMSVLNRLEVSVADASGAPAAGATVTLDLGEAGSVSAISGADGKAYLFPKTDAAEYAVFAGYGDARTAAVRTDEGSCFVTLEETRAWSGLDLCFMIDTTGSMGDELRYLQSEVADVIERVTTELSETDIALAFVFYRDEGDEYKVKSSDFTSDIAAQQRVLASESASGGGDTPEAVHEALQEVLGLSWREGTRKILIPVLDAPPHDVPENGQDMRSEYGRLVYTAAERGLACIPVVASGTDALTQYLMRSTALLTGGKYVFLTDDSGIGYSHERPAVGEFTVEYLNSCLVRLIGELYDGRERPAVDYRQESAGA